ncbi:hypothetical protein HDU91_007034 [Kappamyces sp. JEL0680]|nr:hypothetical protein HDU91_007034 [Kappamyces sp. JEL0680]
MCDFHLNYAGCPNVADFEAADLAAICLHISSILAYGTYLAKRLRSVRARRAKIFDSWNGMDTTATLASIYGFLRIALLSHMRSISALGDLAAVSDETIQTWVRTNIFIEMMVWIFGGQAISAVVASLVRTACGAGLFDPIVVRGNRINPENVLRLIRLAILATIAATFSCWGTLGIYQDEAAYKMWRRATYITLGLFSTFVSPSILMFFGVSGDNGVGTHVHNFASTTVPQEPETLDEVEPPRATDSFPKTKALMTASRSDHSKKKLVSKSQGIAQRKIRALAIVIQMTTFALYLPSALYLFMFVVLNETLATNYFGLFLSKVLIDIYIWYATDLKTNTELALKTEPLRTRHPQLEYEVRVYKTLLGGGN